MSLSTNLRGRLRNTKLPKNDALLPVFEAVINSIQSIEEAAIDCDKRQINLIIHRARQGRLPIEEQSSTPEPIDGFTIEDNGCGFNENNIDSFKTLDSEYKIEKGCRGVGRLLWLKAFASVEVNSVFINQDGDKRSRKFSFNERAGVYGEDTIDSCDNAATGTKVKLKGFIEDYRKQAPKRSDVIASHLLQHCLWYFIRPGGCPDINVIEEGGEKINLQSLFEIYMHSKAQSESIDVLGHQFELTHIMLDEGLSKRHQIALCAANRLVEAENIQGKLPGLHKKPLSDENGCFIYVCYVASKYLDENVRSERTSFDISDDDSESLFDSSMPSKKVILEKVLDRTKHFLKEYLDANRESSKRRVDEFIERSAPRYRPIEKYVCPDQLIVDPEISDSDLELHLHRQWYEIERDIVREGNSVLSPPDDESSSEEYEERLNLYLQKVSDLKKSDLANYVSHRKVIVELFKKSIEVLNNGKYSKEDRIHQLIMPMGTDSENADISSSNFWLIDERLAFHHFIASDKTLKSMPITNSESTTEPDVLSLNVFDNPILLNEDSTPPLASITIFEIKRPMRNDMAEGLDKNPIEQALGYLDRIRAGSVTTKSGRPIPNSPDIPGYCYILCDLSTTMIRRCKLASLTVTADGMGFFGYNPEYKAYIEVMSFDRLIRSASERNRAFFDMLGLPVS